MLPICEDAIFVEGDSLMGKFPPTLFHIIGVILDCAFSDMTVSFVVLIQP
jgi:hypothetical protein